MYFSCYYWSKKDKRRLKISILLILSILFNLFIFYMKKQEEKKENIELIRIIELDYEVEEQKKNYLLKKAREKEIYKKIFVDIKYKDTNNE